MRQESLQPADVDPSRVRTRHALRVDPFVALAGAYLLAALVLGGSSTMLTPTAALDLAALPLAAVGAIRHGYQGVDAEARWPLILVGLMLLLPVLQLVPAPPALWSGLPGHEAVGAALDLARVPRQSAPVSLFPDGTWRALFGLAPPTAMFVATLSLRDRERRILAGCVAIAALASIGLFVFQRFGGEGRTLFGLLDLSASKGASGFFGNRNHQTTLLAVGVPLSVLAVQGAWRTDWRAPAVASIAVSLMLVVGALVTTSRAAFILGPLAAMLGLAVALRMRSARPSAWLETAPLALLAGACALAVALVVAMSVGPVAERFDAAAGELRLSLFPIVARAGLDFAPFGSGLGTFAQVYQVYEPSGLIGPAFVNHAHNEFLELWLEAGVPGLVLLLAFLGWVIWTAFRRSGASAAERATAMAGLAVVVLILVHSLVDYPLRTPAIAAVFGLACAMLVRPPADLAPERRSNFRAAGAAVVLVPAVGALGWTCLSHTASSYYDQQDPVRSLGWNPRNPQALASQAELAFGQSATGRQAERQAEIASREMLAVAPLDAGSYRRLALLAEADGRLEEARALMRAADRWSRRDELTQTWLMLDNLKQANFDGALERADLILRQWWQLESVVFPVLRQQLGDTRMRGATIRALARSPGWRAGFLRTLARDDATTAAAREIHDGLRKTKAPPTADETALLITSLVDQGRLAEARDEWARAVGVKPGLGVYNGDFVGRPGGPPFNWRFGPTTAPMTLDDGSTALAARPSDQEGGLLAEQVLDLPPGAYRFKLDGRAPATDDTGGSSALEWRLNCLKHEPSGIAKLEVATLPSTWSAMSVPFVVEPGCVGQRLQLHSVGASDGGVAYFRHIAIEPAANSP